MPDLRNQKADSLTLTDTVADALEVERVESHLNPPASYDLADHPVPTGREETWRFTPLKRLRGILDGESSDACLSWTTSLPEGITMPVISSEEAREQGALPPNERPAALAMSLSGGCQVIDVPAEWSSDEPIMIDLRGDDADALVWGELLVKVGRHAKATLVVTHTGSARYSAATSVVVEDGKRKETGSYGSGGRHDYSAMLDAATWQHHVDEALRQALILVEADAAPAGEMPVVLGPGWPGILLHEAIGHGLEGDFNRKETSVFSGLMGERVGAPGVTVIDDGTIAARRGSLSIDDEGTPTQRTALIEDGILTGYMHDRLNARLMGTKSTGNGRRQSFAHQPMPRMRNTIMLGGNDVPEDIIRGVDKGLFAVNFGGGQVDITSGKFVFSASEAYRIEGGKVGAPVKGATLIGTGHEVLKNVRAIGNDLALDPGIGTCGKNGQGVPVGVGQPTVLVDGLTVGGTEAE